MEIKDEYIDLNGQAVKLNSRTMFGLILIFYFFGSSFCLPGRNSSWTENELTTATGIFELFEGNSASQNMVCTLIWTQVRNIFKNLFNENQDIVIATCTYACSTSLINLEWVLGFPALWCMWKRWGSIWNSSDCWLWHHHYPLWQPWWRQRWWLHRN